MLESVHKSGKGSERMLLIDTCGDGAGVAVSVGTAVVAAEALPRGGGSAEIVGAVQKVLSAAGCALRQLNAVGVVSGPGSFTGVRVGMSAAKGLSEAAGVRLLSVSRLAVLWEISKAHDGLVALDAGRGECYVRDSHGCEGLATTEEVREKVQTGEVVVVEEKVAFRLEEMGIRVRREALSVVDTLKPVRRMLNGESSVLSPGDANYVRRESDIYKPGRVG
jgi:tRNA threonylcarbamoyladenosine biosynthesis protein TsaB